MEDGTHSSPYPPLPSVRSCGKDSGEDKEQPHAQPVFSRVCPLHHYVQGSPTEWHTGREDIMIYLWYWGATTNLPSYLSMWWVQASHHSSHGYSADTMVCFLGILVLPLTTHQIFGTP